MKLLRLGANVRQRAEDRPHRLCHSLTPRVAPGLRPVSHDILDARVSPLGRAVVATLDGRVDRAHKVQVLRHRPQGNPRRDRLRDRATALQTATWASRALEEAGNKRTRLPA